MIDEHQDTNYVQEQLLRTLAAATGNLCVVGDEDRLRQVLLNLAGNAVKFTQSGGVGISVARGKAGEIVISVRDTGPGIAASQLGAIFDEFERADATLASRHEGVGLGLAISRRIVARMTQKVLLNRHTCGALFGAERCEIDRLMRHKSVFHELIL